MYKHPEKLRPVIWSWAGPDRGRPRSPSPYPVHKKHGRAPRLERRPAASRPPRRSYRYVDAQFDEDVQRQIDQQNARIAKRAPAPRHIAESKRSLEKRVRFALPVSRSDADREDALAWEFAKLSIYDRDSGSGRRRCSRCGQTFRHGRIEG